MVEGYVFRGYRFVTATIRLILTSKDYNLYYNLGYIISLVAIIFLFKVLLDATIKIM